MYIYLLAICIVSSRAQLSTIDEDLDLYVEGLPAIVNPVGGDHILEQYPDWVHAPNITLGTANTTTTVEIRCAKDIRAIGHCYGTYTLFDPVDLDHSCVVCTSTCTSILYISRIYLYSVAYHNSICPNVDHSPLYPVQFARTNNYPEFENEQEPIALLLQTSEGENSRTKQFSVQHHSTCGQFDVSCYPGVAFASLIDWLSYSGNITVINGDYCLLSQGGVQTQLCGYYEIKLDGHGGYYGNGFITTRYPLTKPFISQDDIANSRATGDTVFTYPNEREVKLDPGSDVYIKNTRVIAFECIRFLCGRHNILSPRPTLVAERLCYCLEYSRTRKEFKLPGGRQLRYVRVTSQARYNGLFYMGTSDQRCAQLKRSLHSFGEFEFRPIAGNFLPHSTKDCFLGGTVFFEDSTGDYSELYTDSALLPTKVSLRSGIGAVIDWEAEKGACNVLDRRGCIKKYSVIRHQDAWHLSEPQSLTEATSYNCTQVYYESYASNDTGGESACEGGCLDGDNIVLYEACEYQIYKVIAIFLLVFFGACIVVAGPMGIYYHIHLNAYANAYALAGYKHIAGTVEMRNSEVVEQLKKADTVDALKALDADQEDSVKMGCCVEKWNLEKGKKFAKYVPSSFNKSSARRALLGLICCCCITTTVCDTRTLSPSKANTEETVDHFLIFFLAAVILFFVILMVVGLVYAFIMLAVRLARHWSKFRDIVQDRFQGPHEIKCESCSDKQALLMVCMVIAVTLIPCTAGQQLFYEATQPEGYEDFVNNRPGSEVFIENAFGTAVGSPTYEIVGGGNCEGIDCSCTLQASENNVRIYKGKVMTFKGICDSHEVVQKYLVNSIRLEYDFEYMYSWTGYYWDVKTGYNCLNNVPVEGDFTYSKIVSNTDDCCNTSTAYLYGSAKLRINSAVVLHVFKSHYKSIDYELCTLNAYKSFCNLIGLNAGVKIVSSSSVPSLPTYIGVLVKNGEVISVTDYRPVTNEWYKPEQVKVKYTTNGVDILSVPPNGFRFTGYDYKCTEETKIAQQVYQISYNYEGPLINNFFDIFRYHPIQEALPNIRIDKIVYDTHYGVPVLTMEQESIQVQDKTSVSINTIQITPKYNAGTMPFSSITLDRCSYAVGSTLVSYCIFSVNWLESTRGFVLSLQSNTVSAFKVEKYVIVAPTMSTFKVNMVAFKGLSSVEIKAWIGKIPLPNFKTDRLTQYDIKGPAETVGFHDMSYTVDTGNDEFDTYNTGAVAVAVTFTVIYMVVAVLTVYFTHRSRIYLTEIRRVSYFRKLNY